MSYTRTRRIAAAVASVAAVAGLALAPAAIAQQNAAGHALPAGARSLTAQYTPTGTATLGGHTYTVTGGTWNIGAGPVPGQLQVKADLVSSSGVAVVTFNVTAAGNTATVQAGSTIDFDGTHYGVNVGGKIALTSLLPPQNVSASNLATDHGPVSFNLNVR